MIISRFFNIGSGSTWPGHIALTLNKNFIKDILKTNDQRLKTILVAGTNGKTTTGKLIKTILAKGGYKVFQNESGANLLNGISSTLIHQCNVVGEIDNDFGIFEVDENTLPLILKEISSPDFVIILNLFRDQLDRYGEVNVIAEKWGNAIVSLASLTTLILNADDPQIASLGMHLKGVKLKFFGLNDKSLATFKNQHAVDSTYCSNCGAKLIYSEIYFSHLGVWECPKCDNTRPKLDISASPIYPLLGIYNRYNTIASVSLSRQLNIEENNVVAGLKNFKPAFGRQEILNINGKKIQIFLSKNPTSFNESLRTIAGLKAKNVLFVLNDSIPDGRDVSWIWDVDFEDYIDKFKNIIVSGDRAYDIALRIKYTTKNSNIKSQNYNSKLKIYEELKEAIDESLKLTSKNEALYILPTYSAMLETRKILTGKKIL